jgi:hypothetical protein
MREVLPSSHSMYIVVWRLIDVDPPRYRLFSLGCAIAVRGKVENKTWSGKQHLHYDRTFESNPKNGATCTTLLGYHIGC